MTYGFDLLRVSVCGRKYKRTGPDGMSKSLGKGGAVVVVSLGR